MFPTDDRSLLNNLNALAHHQPAPDAADRALARTRAALLQSQSSHHKRRLFMRIAIPSSIAAAVIAATLIFFSLQSSRQASAAEKLDAAVQTTKAYKGWVKLATHIPLDMTQPATMPTPTQDYSSYHSSDGSSAWGVTLEGEYQFTLWSIPQKEISTYFPGINEIHIGNMRDAEIEIQSASKDMWPTTFADMLAGQKRTFGRDPLAIKETPEGDLTRFDVTVFTSPEEAQRFVKEHSSPNVAWSDLSTTTTLWVNRDHLVTRVQANGTVTDYTYIPEVHDLYDLGIPRSAKVIDNRLTQDLLALMDRTDARAVRAFGNYTALISDYRLDANNTPSPDFGYIYLYTVQNNRWLANQYRLFQAMKPHEPRSPNFVLEAPPANWPSPDLEKLLPVLHDAAPVEYCYMDGDSGRSGFFQAKTLQYSSQTLQPLYATRTFAQNNVTTYIWPDRINTSIGSTAVHTDLLHDQDHPGLIGLHYIRLEKPSDDTDGGSTWWLDPTKDDMPVDYSWSSTDANGKPTATSHTHYLKYTQLPNGQWYPTDWREDRSYLDPRTGKYADSTYYYRLQILPNFQLDPSWFQPPHPKTLPPQPLP